MCMEKLVTLGKYLDYNEASIIKGLLESNGIEAHLFDESLATYLPTMTVGGIRLVVKESDLTKALEIIKNIE